MGPKETIKSNDDTSIGKQMAESALHLGCNLVSTFYLEGYLLHRTGGNFQSQRNRKLLLWHHNGSISSSKISWFHRAFLEAQATMRDEVWLSITSSLWMGTITIFYTDILTVSDYVLYYLSNMIVYIWGVTRCLMMNDIPFEPFSLAKPN